MSYYKSPTEQIEENFVYKALVASAVMHGLCILLQWEMAPIQPDIRDNAIKVELVSAKLPEVKKVIPVPPAPVIPEPVKKVVAEKPKPKIDKGTEKVVAKAKELGNPNAKKVQKVQRGDPVSKVMAKNNPANQFRKLKADNIGTGGTRLIETAVTQSGGSGDTYKGPDFAVKSLSATGKLGKRFSINKVDDGGAGTGIGGGIGDGAGKGFGDGTITGRAGGTLEKAKIVTNVGSLTGATTGKIDSSKGSEGLSRKGTIALAGTPSETVVMGSMDPNLIRQILMDHLAQFRYCYQSELEKADDSKASGVLNLNFDIGSNGNVKRAVVTGAQSIGGSVKGCVAGVLKGISFPEPMGGGIVEVKQPMNFYPKYN